MDKAKPTASPESRFQKAPCPTFSQARKEAMGEAGWVVERGHRWQPEEALPCLTFYMLGR